MLYLHSINKEFTMEITPPATRFAALDINPHETRLYCSQAETLRIFDISDPKNPTQLASIPINDTYFKISTWADKYLFGIAKAGYITVF